MERLDPILIDKTLAYTIRKAANQVQLAAWNKHDHDDIARAPAIRTATASLNAKAQHLATAVT